MYTDKDSNLISDSKTYFLELGILMTHSYCRQSQQGSDTSPTKVCSLYIIKSFKEEVQWLQQQDITTPVGIDETVEKCKSFV